MIENMKEVARDLVAGGIPPLAARDIVDVAAGIAHRSRAPMAIFWDLENMPIPTTSSGRDVACRLKSILSPYGELTAFRGYASIGLGNIPQQKRSDLQLSGCALVDCPHVGRKEVADKMIIVDAMNFAMNNPEGATLAFVTGDVDYAYMLATLQPKKQYRTIVISKGTLQSMLDVNCDIKMRWETDILQLRSSSLTGRQISTSSPQDLGLVDDSSMNATESSLGNLEDASERDDHFEALTADEEWNDDVEVLRNIVRRESDFLGFTQKSIVGSTLRTNYPARFPHRESLQQFMAQAIERGIVCETDRDGLRWLSLPTDETTGMFPAMSLSNKPPIPLEDLPEKAWTISSTRNYIVFVKWRYCPPGTKLPSTAFVVHKGSWGILMFNSLVDSQQTVSEYPWLRNGILVDWRKIFPRGGSAPSIRSAAPKLGPGQVVPAAACMLCRAVRQDVNLVQVTPQLLACPECVAWKDLSLEEKDVAARKVVRVLEILAENDEIVASAKGNVRYLLQQREDFNCDSRKSAALWVEHAIENQLVTQFGPKKKLVCLPSLYSEAQEPMPPEDFDTSREEEHVLELLTECDSGWINRKDVIQSLKETFPRMSHPNRRTAVMRNGARNNKFTYQKGPYGQVVGLTPSDADVGLDTLARIALGKYNTASGDSEGPAIPEKPDVAFDNESGLTDPALGEDDDMSNSHAAVQGLDLLETGLSTTVVDDDKKDGIVG
ncbi:hypothetical protein THAOC_06575 [Thalassiosira oceanica]|uniref:NYN domain-containing protein n=1 Tax=Thalassiosira oceanica TaxID=159749 RepID=K0T2E0_THAOC|nr:hypothetical protein THAOC_06575 [Thalassiosira oceanica]|eukprot:EJK71940.1 hypothetical protein THAOC_06575 [Thalassiosira oceanica]